MNLLVYLKNKFILNKDKIFKTILLIIGVSLVLLLSGSGFTNFGMSSKGKIVLYIVTFLYFVTFYVLKIKTSFFKEAMEKKRIPFPKYITFATFLIIFFLLISFIFNPNKTENLNSYIAFTLTVFLSYLILSAFEHSFLLKVFKNTLFILVSIAVLIYIFTVISGTFYPSIFFTSDKSIYGSHLFVSNDLISGLTTTFYFKIRLTSVFWEPSVLAVMLISGLVVEIYSERDKLTFIRILAFIVGIILSKSTTAYILLPVVLFLFLAEKLKNLYVKSFVVFIFIVSTSLIILYEEQVIDFLVTLAPDIFSKMSSGTTTSSFVTRLEAFGTCFNVFLKSPIIGFGGVSAREQYFLISNVAVDAQTSTFGYVLSSFGFAGVIYFASIFFGIIISKKIDSFAKFVFIPLVFLLSNAQAQGEILILNILYFLPLATCLLPKKINAYNQETFKDSYSSNKMVKDYLLAKSDGGEVSRNVTGAFIIRGIAILIAFFTVPVYLRYFNNSDSIYGIWLAITSILSIIMVFDFGMGNGLKNRLIENIEKKDDAKSKTYVSTTYVLTSIVALFVFVVFAILIFTISDNVLLSLFFSDSNPLTVDLATFRLGVAIILLAICSHFSIKNINYVLQAHQKNAITSLFMVITNFSSLLFALIFADVFDLKYRILALSLAYFVFLITPLLIANIILFKTKFKNISPSFKCVDFKKSREVVSTSFKFFAVQIGNLFLWSLNEWIILFAFGKPFVVEYTEYYKLFSLVPILLGTVIQQPLWTAISKADAESNKPKIKKYIKVIAICTGCCIAFNLLLSLGLSFVFDLWLGDQAPSITPAIQMSFISYSVIYSVALSLVIIMNALSLFKTQIITATIGILLKIPAIILIKNVFHLDVGWELIMYINTACYLPIAVFGGIEIYHRLKKIGVSQ